MCVCVCLKKSLNYVPDLSLSYSGFVLLIISLLLRLCNNTTRLLDILKSSPIVQLILCNY